MTEPVLTSARFATQPVDVARTSEIRAATLAEWRELFEADHHATFFHGPAWAEIWEAYTGGAARPHPIRVEFDDGRRAILGTTRVRTRIPGIGRDVLSPEGNCGGWVSADTLGVQHAKALAEIVLRSRSCVWRIGPADKEIQALPRHHVRDEVTHVIDLRDGPDAARERWNPEARRTAARARRRGARVTVGTSKRHWNEYAHLYRSSIQRWDRPLFTYRDSLFSQLAELSDRGVHLWLAEIDGEACAGAVLLTHHHYATYWHGATDPQLCPGATNLLHWELLDTLAEAGIETYDLNGSGSLAGVARFKESLGAQRARVVAYARRHPLERGASTAKRLLVGRQS